MPLLQLRTCGQSSFLQIFDIRTTEVAFHDIQMKSAVIGSLGVENPQQEAPPIFPRRTAQLKIFPDGAGGNFVETEAFDQSCKSISEVGLISQRSLDRPRLLR